MLTTQVGRERGRRRRRLRELWEDCATSIDHGAARVELEELIEVYTERCPADLREGFVAVVREGISLREAEVRFHANRKRLALFMRAFGEAVRA